MSRRGDPLSDLPVGEDGEVDLSKLTERQQIALLLKQSEEEARKPTPTPKSRKPPSTPRSSRAKDPEPHSSRGHGSGSKKEVHVNTAYDEFASEHQQSSKDGLWTPREHDRFMQIVDQHPGEIQWSDVVQQIEGRTEQQCSEYMQRLLDRGLIKYHQGAPALSAPPANQTGVVASSNVERAHQTRTPLSETKRQREYTSSSLLASANQPRSSYKRVRSDQIPELLPKVSMAEISEHAKALLVEIEATEAKYEAAQKSCEVPELAKVPPAEPEPDNTEVESQLDPELLNQQQHERHMLREQFTAEIERAAVWFRESCAREAFEGDDIQAPWDVAVGFVLENQCLASPEAAPTAQPPKKRLSKLARQFEQMKAALIKQQTERARALGLVQSWRLQGCGATRANTEAIGLAVDPAQLSLAQHIQGQTLGKFPTVKVNFPYFIKNNRA